MNRKFLLFSMIMGLFFLFMNLLPVWGAGFVDDKIDEFINQGDELIKQGKYQEALNQYQQALDMNEEKAISHYKMGVAYYFLKNYEKAIEHYKRSIRLDDENLKAYNNLALIYMEQGNYIEAKMMYEKVLELDPKYNKARYNLAITLYRLEKWDNALEVLQELVQQEPQHSNGYNLMGQIYDSRKDYPKAGEMYLKAVESDNKNYLARYNYAKILYLQKKPDQALENLTKLVAENPKYYRGFFLMGFIYEKKEDYTKAEDMYLKALGINSNDKFSADGIKRLKYKKGMSDTQKSQWNMAMGMADFELPSDYEFTGIREILNGVKIIDLKYKGVQDINIIKFPDSYMLGDKKIDQIMTSPSPEFQQFLKNMGIPEYKIEKTDLFDYTSQTGEDDKDEVVLKKTYVLFSFQREGKEQQGVILRVETPNGADPQLLLLSISPASDFNLDIAGEFFRQVDPAQ